MNPDRLICGLATVFDAPSRNGGRRWYAEEWRAFADAGMAVPLLIRHEGRAEDPDTHLGMWRGFAAIEGYGEMPPGLLAVGEFNTSSRGHELLEHIAADLNPWAATGTVWGLSVTAADVAVDRRCPQWHASEVSLTADPAHEMARVLGVGAYAGDVWRALTNGRDVPEIPSTRRVVRLLIGADTHGRPIYRDEEW